MNRFMNYRKEKGITLIALIITIIVLLILAGIAIGALTTNNSVLRQAGNAKNETKTAEEKEKLQVAIMAAIMKDKDNKLSEDNLREEIKDDANIEIKRNKIVVTFDDSEIEYEVNKTGDISERKKVDVDSLPKMSNTKFKDGLADDKANILSVTVLDELNPPTDVYKIIDVSKSSNGTIKAWLIENSENAGKYDLFVGGKGGVRIDDCNATFNGFTVCTDMDLSNLYIDGVTRTTNMFWRCTSLVNIDISSFNTQGITNTAAMFRNCENLKYVDVSGFDMSNVTTVSRMFDGCNKLEKLDVEDWDIGKVQSTTGMFLYCYKLNNLDVSNWDTSSVTDMAVAYGGMFQGCSSLEYLDVSNWDVSNVVNMGLTDGGMFQSCSKLKTLDLSKWNTSNVVAMKSMFRTCSSLTTIYVGDNWDVSNVTNSADMFKNCTKLVGDISFNSSVVDKTYATATGGYLTYKRNP